MKQTKNNKLSHGVKKTAVASILISASFSSNSVELQMYDATPVHFGESWFPPLENSSMTTDSCCNYDSAAYKKNNKNDSGDPVGHTGVDLGMNTTVPDVKGVIDRIALGAPVYAIENSVIVARKLHCKSDTYNLSVILGEHLLSSGEIATGIYGHAAPKDLSCSTGKYSEKMNKIYVAKGQRIGYVKKFGDIHLHFGIAINKDKSNLLTGWGRYAAKNNAVIPDYFRNPETYLPANENATPFLSKSDQNQSPNKTNYDVFGIAEQPIYANLNLNGKFQESSILVRNFATRADAEKNGTAEQIRSFDDAHRYLGGQHLPVNKQKVLVSGITADNTYSEGNYLFLAYVKDGDKKRFGYPVKFTFVPEGSVIIDNDQQNTKPFNADEIYNNQPAYRYAGTQGEKVPGYFLTAELHKRRSGDSVQWRPNKAGKYKIYVHVPEYGATATEVYYSIKDDGETSIQSQPVNQKNNADKWVQIFDKDRLEDFEFTKDGYLSLGLFADKNSANYGTNDTDKIAFDAVKFVCEAPCSEPQAVSNITAAKVSKTSIQKGEQITFSAVLDKPLEGYSVRVKYGADLLRMEPDTSAQNFSLTVTPSTAGNYPYSIGIYDDKDVLQGKEFAGESFTVTENTATGDYTKIANDGSELPDSANLGANPKDWACTRDNKTKLIWEVKTTDGGLRDMNKEYTWQQSFDFATSVNQQEQGLCGAKDWRMPNNEELKSLVYCSDNQTKTLGKEEYGYICTGSPTRPTINTTYFPNTLGNLLWFWSSSPGANGSNYAWGVGFGGGFSDDLIKGYSYNVRLVR